MSQEQVGIKKVPGIGIVAAFGLLTMSSSIASNSFTTMNVSPDCYYEVHNYINNDNTVCNSSMLSRQAVGDIVSFEKRADFVQQHEKINVNLQITKITRHISSFEFEEEYGGDLMEYPWFELQENSAEITQGDIIKGCPVPILKEFNISKEGQNVKAEIATIDGIVLTQACDIANKKVENIILCAITSKGEFEEIQRNARKNEKEIRKSIEGIIKGQQNAYHIINEYRSAEFSQDYYIINFKDIFSVPVDVARAIAEKSGKRLRLCPPYREHLSQAFARYFMRVGLPINIHMD